METFLSAVLGDLMTRSISFIINKCSKPPAMAVEESLQRALLRAQVIIEEAVGRHVTNQSMIQQMGMLRDAIHQGYYALDTFRYQPCFVEGGAKNQVVNRFMSVSKVRFAKEPYFSSLNAQFSEQPQEALDRLSSMIADLKELVMFLRSYPRLYRQPYSMHILLSNCMFGRHMEAELVIKFLLRTQPHGFGELDVLPIVGPFRAGKSTLVAHVCKVERVRDHFSEILFLHDHDIADDDDLAFRKGCALKHKNDDSISKEGKRFLAVIELSGNLCEDAWNRLYLACKQSFPSGSKIIVTSISDEIVKFGTTPALTLKHLSHESFWYLFKTLTFGSIDPNMHPRFMQLAMEIARMQNRSIHSAHNTSYLLRNNFDIHFWSKVLSFLREFIKKHVSKFSVDPFDLVIQNRPVQLARIATPDEYFIVCRQYHRSSQEEVPKIRILDVIYGNIKPQGKFEALVWRSQIPPYYSYVITCEIPERKTTGAKRKRSMKESCHFLYHIGTYIVLLILF